MSSIEGDITDLNNSLSDLDSSLSAVQSSLTDLETPVYAENISTLVEANNSLKNHGSLLFQTNGTLASELSNNYIAVMGKGILFKMGTDYFDYMIFTPAGGTYCIVLGRRNSDGTIGSIKGCATIGL